jgi:selenocysteine lyase/cysteine desulfurase
MPADLSTYREEFPVLERKAYLISASLGPISRRADAYLQEYLEAWRTEGAPDPVWEEHVFPRMRSVKATFAALVGADPDEVSITTNVSLALSTIASCLDSPVGGGNWSSLSSTSPPTDTSSSRSSGAARRS